MIFRASFSAIRFRSRFFDCGMRRRRRRFKQLCGKNAPMLRHLYKETALRAAAERRAAKLRAQLDPAYRSDAALSSWGSLLRRATKRSAKVATYCCAS